MKHESKDNIKSLNKLLNRRGFFKSMAFLGLVTLSTTPLHAKGSKKQFKYQDSPKNGEICKDCMHFEPKSNTCKVVEGSISPNGWCTLFRKPPQ
ncbi:MAG: iron oxidase oxidoreductase [Arcobacter sp.]|uniref:iron oxidase oxidoreductase n=1 Tax=uncultured Arcobacter sp. TaxID=165434 RepID=UPI000CA9C349|nr:iron oxidase oxidoreductase [uncultured Arcobacter sp.]PLY11024.1 MAG: iron oxidase oxidoreductase [Arcobacter sp.]